MFPRRALVALLSVVAVAYATRVQGAGLYFSDRGVRPMGRAGAFVAGADDLHSIWYNPAGLADAGTAVLVDFAWLRFQNQYTRRLRIVDADDTVRVVDSPTIRGSSSFLPLPTMAISFVLDEAKKWTIAAGTYAPYVALASYPEKTDDGQPSPARYTLGSYDGTAMVLPGAWVSWKPIEQLRIGFGALALIGVFQSTITFSVSPQDRLIGAPEQPEWDAQSQMRVGPIFAPTANGGIIFEPDPHIRIGFSAQAPVVISSAATIKVKLPTSVALDSARVRGEDAHVKFTLPGILRFGIELRPTPNLRAEIGYVRELWSAHKSIEATPKDIRLEGITGAPASVAMPPIVIPRNFVDSNSYRLGIEYRVEVAQYRLDFRTGLSHETSAVPKGYLSLSSLDFVKTTLCFGGSISIGQHWRFDAIYAHTFASDAHVSPDEARIGRINPLKGNAPLEAVNGGTYTATADLIGVGTNYRF